MGMDIYAGTLPRYYAQNWKTVAQQFAEENGWAYQRIMPERTSPEEGDSLSPTEIQADIEQWRDRLLKALTPEGRDTYAPWPEDNELPYYTDKPDWDGFGALLLYTAAGKLAEPLPPTVEKGWNFNDNPLISAMREQEGKAWSLFSGATCWLPIENGFYFTGPMPNGNQAVIGTSTALRMELEAINGRGWQARRCSLGLVPKDTPPTGVFINQRMETRDFSRGRKCAIYSFWNMTCVNRIQCS